jgi:hypothetical protein
VETVSDLPTPARRRAPLALIVALLAVLGIAGAAMVATSASTTAPDVVLVEDATAPAAHAVIRRRRRRVRRLWATLARGRPRIAGRPVKLAPAVDLAVGPGGAANRRRGPPLALAS